MSPVVRDVITTSELVGNILGLTGKDPTRIREILALGTFVNGPSRRRWKPFVTTEEELLGLLEKFPDIQPDRPFEAARCYLITIRGQRSNVRLPRETANVRRWLRKASYWDILLETLENAQLLYENYSYSEHADIYSFGLSLEIVNDLLSKTTLLKYSSLIEKLRYAEPTALAAFVKREGPQ